MIKIANFINIKTNLMKKIYLLLFTLLLFSQSFAATVGPIMGDSVICAGSGTVLSDTSAGGVWISGDPSVATIGSSSGNVVGVIAGTTVIYYMTGSTVYDTFVLTVNSIPDAITGTTAVLTGGSIALSDAFAGGVWASSNTAIAAADSATGVVSGISAGSVVITYILGDGCYTVDSIAVYNLATSLTGAGSVCAGSMITLTDSMPGGSWSSSDTGIAKVDSGIVTGIAAGTATITYNIDTNYVTQVVTVNASPSAILGGPWFYACAGGPYYGTTLVDSTPGGIWTSSDTGFIKIGAISGIMSVGVDSDFFSFDSSIMTYQLATGCSTSIVVFIYCEGIPTVINTNEISIFPNPVYDEATIRSTHDVIKQVLLTNMLGQTVAGRQFAVGGLECAVDVSGLPAGVYFVQVNGSEVRRFVKE